MSSYDDEDDAVDQLIRGLRSLGRFPDVVFCCSFLPFTNGASTCASPRLMCLLMGSSLPREKEHNRPASHRLFVILDRAQADLDQRVSETTATVIQLQGRVGHFNQRRHKLTAVLQQAEVRNANLSQQIHHTRAAVNQ